jgi:hypothetical protein
MTRSLHGADDPLYLVQATLSRATPEVLGMSMLRADPHFQRVETGSAPALVEAALGDGRRLGALARSAWGTDPYVVAQRRAVRVVEAAGDHGYGTTVLYAEYCERPPLIRLFGAPIGALNRHLADPRLRSALGVVDAASVFLAHELYHHLDCTCDWPRLAARHRVTLLRLGPLRWTTGLVSLYEIAAGAFAQHLLGLRYHPKVLDILTLFDSEPSAARRMAESLNRGWQSVAPQMPEGVAC